jgi:hypothetical protein
MSRQAANSWPVIRVVCQNDGGSIMKRYHAFLVGIVLLLYSSLYAATIHVPADQLTIQAGINKAVDGDTVLVAPGTYTENVAFNGKRVVLRSLDGPEVTTIRAADGGKPAVSLIASEPKGAVVSGFGITGCTSASGVLCVGSSPTIVNNIITGNTGPYGNYGGGITLYNTTGSVIKGNMIHHNTEVYGGAIHVGDDNASSTQDTIAYNTIYGNVGVGDIRVLGSVSELEVNSNTISVVTYCGIYGQGGNVNARNNIVFGAPAYGMRSNGGAILAEYNCTFGNASDYNFPPGVGNIYQNAMFKDTSAHNYRLLPGSPCINAGDLASQYNDPDGSRNDMGAFPGGVGNVPVASDIGFGSGSVDGYVVVPWPTIYWRYLDTAATTQTQFKIEVGTDADWSVAEMWQSGTVASSDTDAVYAGLPLANRQIYFLRIRVSNSVGWGDWLEYMFSTHIGGSIIIHVPTDQPTIQAGINAAMDGDTVLVAPGTYTENLVISGKSISVVSVSGAQTTTILPASTSANTVYLNGNSGRTNLIQGFRFSGASGKRCIESTDGTVIVDNNDFVDNAADDARAVCVRGAAEIRNNRFKNNTCQLHGGGVLILNAAGTLIERNEFRHNSARCGGGIDLLGAGNVVVRYNLLVGNSATEFGGAIYLGASSNILMTNNTIDSCLSSNSTGGGISFWACTNDTAFNNIIINCTGYGIWQGGSSGYMANYDDCWSNIPSDYSGITPGAGSLSADPRFLGGIPFNYHLKGLSPCINAGNLDPLYNDSDGSRNDMGACPFSNHAPLSFTLLTPGNTTSVGVSTLRPLFSWDDSVDPDTGDIVTYDLVIATDSNFSFVQQVLNLAAPGYTLTTDLQWGRQYWWNVKASDGNGGEIWSPQMFTFRTMTLGDSNNDAIVNVADIVFLINYIFMGGVAPQPLMTADLNCDGRTNIADVVYLINYVFLSGPTPCDGFPN